MALCESVLFIEYSKTIAPKVYPMFRILSSDRKKKGYLQKG